MPCAIFLILILPNLKKELLPPLLKTGVTGLLFLKHLLPQEKIARINESMYKFVPAFYLQERPVRDYPFDAGGNILGYLSEVDSSFLKQA